MRAIDADALIDYLQIIPIDLGYREVEEIEEYVRSMPTIEPQRKKGKWRKVSADRYVSSAKYVFVCSECNENVIGDWNFCPNCGADMMEENK